MSCQPKSPTKMRGVTKGWIAAHEDIEKIAEQFPMLHPVKEIPCMDNADHLHLIVTVAEATVAVERTGDTVTPLHLVYNREYSLPSLLIPSPSLSCTYKLRFGKGSTLCLMAKYRPPPLPPNRIILQRHKQSQRPLSTMASIMERN